MTEEPCLPDDDQATSDLREENDRLRRKVAVLQEIIRDLSRRIAKQRDEAKRGTK